MAVMRWQAVARPGAPYVKGPRQPREGDAAWKTDPAPEEAGFRPSNLCRGPV
jgi:hypothetical protein